MKRAINKLYPQIYVNTVLDIPLDELKNAGIRALIFDLDNTITEWNSNDIRSEICDWFALVKELGFKACLLSNNHEQRVLQVAQNLGIPYIYRAQKPRRGGYYRAMASMQVDAPSTAVIGDQIFTDILGGNRAGLYTILVTPIARREFMGTKISRTMEYFVLRRLKKRK
jgi:hypothetical protein